MTTPEPQVTAAATPPTPVDAPTGSGASLPTPDGVPPSFAEAEAQAVEDLVELLDLYSLRDQVLALTVQVEQLTRALELAPSTRPYLQSARRR